MDTRESAAVKVRRQIEALIIDGSLQPGEKIPSERQLCARLGASRPVIREAMMELRGRGVIQTQHGKGSFVTNILENTSQSSPINKIHESHPNMLFDLLEVRESLEGQAARLAAERATEKDINNITRAFTHMNSAYERNAEVKDAANLDHAFHHSIYAASHNSILIHTLQNLTLLMRDSVMVTVGNLYHHERSKQQIKAYHRLIYNAIIDRKPHNAEKAAMEHVRDVRDRILDLERQEQRVVRAELLNE